jgi:pentose-5-phosphate-3-epimerase
MPFESVDDYVNQLRRLSSYYKYFQLDFSDGIFVEEKTADLRDVLDALSSIKEHWINELVMDFHFMVKDYKAEIEKLKVVKNTFKINNIFIHLSAIDDFSDPLNYDDFNVGVVLNPENSVESLSKKINLDKMPFIQIMSVIPGAQGRPFIPETLNKIDQLRSYNYRNKIYLDGAVNDKTLTIIAARKNPPDVVCPGSFLTKCPDDELKNRYDYLLKFS